MLKSLVQLLVMVELFLFCFFNHKGAGFWQEISSLVNSSFNPPNLRDRSLQSTVVQYATSNFPIDFFKNFCFVFFCGPL